MTAPFSLLPLAGGGFVLGAIASFVATRIVLGQLRKRNLLDIPNERSSHTSPTPRGGGWGVVAGAAASWVLVGPFLESGPWMLGLGLAVAIAIVLSWRDDLGGLSVRVRLATQFAAAAAALAALAQTHVPYSMAEAAAILAPGLPVVLVLFVGLPIVLTGYVWFVNLYNFMDGIDGLTAIETLCVLIGIAAVALAAGKANPLLVAYPLIVAGAASGFLAWNWHPAKVFLGDVGSVPLGLVVGFFLLALAAYGNPVSAVILPLYYIADATLTLLRRLAGGAKPWQAHRTHWYQRAAAAVGHRKTVLVILAGNGGLVGLSLLALTHPLAALATALIWTAMLLRILSRLAVRAVPAAAA